MAEVRLIPLGIGDAFSTRYYTTCLALGCDDDWILLDCPHPIRKMLREASERAGLPLDLHNISAVVISHLHADHCSGLEDYAFFSHFVLKRPAKLIAHPFVLSRYWNNLLAAGMDTMRLDPDGPDGVRTEGDYFETIALNESAPVVYGPFSIECRPTFHAVRAWAVRIKVGGKSFGFSADTCFDPKLIEWLAPCDLIVHEGTTFKTPVHTLYSDLLTLPEALRKRMRLSHYPDDFDIDASLIEPLREGRCYRID